VNLFKDGWGSPSNPILPRAEWTVVDVDAAPVPG
jgi:hypothetical protein